MQNKNIENTIKTMLYIFLKEAVRRYCRKVSQQKLNPSQAYL